MGIAPSRQWDPAHYLKPSAGLAPKDKLCALLILNHDIGDLNLFETVYQNSMLRVCADGGANRLYDAYETKGEGLYDHLPDCIVGDLDSIRPSVLEFYRKAGVEIRQNGDQYSTDFMKCLDYISEKAGDIPPVVGKENPGDIPPVVKKERAEDILPVVKKEEAEDILPVVKKEEAGDIPPVVKKEEAEDILPVVKKEEAGDIPPVVKDEDPGDIPPVVNKEEAGDITPMVKKEEATEEVEILHGGTAAAPPPPSEVKPKVQPDITVMVFGGFGGRVDHSFHSINVLHKMAHAYNILLLSPENITFLLPSGPNEVQTPQSVFGPTCGLLPVGRTTSLRTKGLKWDLKAEICGFGKLVSTSNHLTSEVTMVDTTSGVVFTMELRKHAPEVDS